MNTFIAPSGLVADQYGNIYLVNGNNILSLSDDGTSRWSSPACNGLVSLFVDSGANSLVSSCSLSPGITLQVLSLETGVQLWAFEGTNSSCSPVVVIPSPDCVIFVCQNDLTRLDGGQETWVYRGDYVEDSSPLVVLSETQVIVATEHYLVSVALNNGSLLWRVQLQQYNITGSLAIVVDSIGNSYLSWQGGIVAFSGTTGNVIYNTPLSFNYCGQSMLLDPLDKTIVRYCGGGNAGPCLLNSFDKETGELGWHIECPYGDPPSPLMPLILCSLDGNLVFAPGGSLISLDVASGNVIWKLPLDLQVNSMALGTDGSLYLLGLAPVARGESSPLLLAYQPPAGWRVVEKDEDS